MLTLGDIDFSHKTVLIREDFNVPIKDGVVQDTARVDATLGTIRAVLERADRVILVSHLGRPTEGEFDEAFSLKPVATLLADRLGEDVTLANDWHHSIPEGNRVVLLENIRFNQGENANDENFAKSLADLADVVVFDAFATAHRAQASTEGVIRYAKQACMGLLLQREVEALQQAWESPKRPVAAIVGGAKISTKLALLGELSQKVDWLIPGGGIANTLLLAKGIAVGKSLVEETMLEDAKAFLASAGDKCLLPVDVVVSDKISNDAIATCKSLDALEATDMILDIGPKTIARYRAKLAECATVIWNGPVGVFEYEPFQAGTKELALAIARSDAYSLAGGGDTLSALKMFGLSDKMSYVSTGGGALLSYLEGEELPAIRALRDKG